MILGALEAVYFIYSNKLIYEGKRQSIKLEDEINGVISYYSDFFWVWRSLYQEIKSRRAGA